MAWRKTSNSHSTYPAETMVDAETIALEDSMIDEALPKNCKEVGAIIHTADYKNIRCKDFDGSWVWVAHEEDA